MLAEKKHWSHYSEYIDIIPRFFSEFKNAVLSCFNVKNHVLIHYLVQNRTMISFIPASNMKLAQVGKLENVAAI